MLVTASGPSSARAPLNIKPHGVPPAQCATLRPDDCRAPPFPARGAQAISAFREAPVQPAPLAFREVRSAPESQHRGSSPRLLATSRATICAASLPGQFQPIPSPPIIAAPDKSGANRHDGLEAGRDDVEAFPAVFADLHSADASLGGKPHVQTRSHVRCAAGGLVNAQSCAWSPVGMLHFFRQSQ